MNKKITKVSPRAQRRKRNGKQQGKNKPLLTKQSRLRGYLQIIERLGYSGITDLNALPKRWRGFNRPGSTK